MKKLIKNNKLRINQMKQIKQVRNIIKNKIL